MKAVVAGESGDLGAIKGWTGRYLAVLGFALRHPAKIVIAAVLVLVAVVVAYGSLGRGVEFFPDVEPNNAVVQVHARGNLAVEERSEEHTSELQSLMRLSYAVFCLKKKKN